jgi:carbon monoxide dehydrogenase subunit G
MQIVESFTVDRPIGEVWALFKDVPEVARCLPGAALTQDHGDGTFSGTLAVKLGPISSSFDGEATVVASDDDFRMEIVGKGVDRSAGSQGRVTVEVTLVAQDSDNTEVMIDAQVMLAGPIAQFGRTGLIAEVSKRLIGDFTECLHAKLSAQSVEESSKIHAGKVKGLSLLFAGLWASIRNVFRKGSPPTD